MANKKIYNEHDSMDINELMSLNEDISPELIEKLQQKLASEAQTFSGGTLIDSVESDDTTLFEEPSQEEDNVVETEDDIFSGLVPSPEEIAKYSAPVAQASTSGVSLNLDDPFAQKFQAKSSPSLAETAKEKIEETPAPVENITGSITEKALTPELKNYKDSLDYLDGNVKYSKYVIYIDPQNVDFIEGLTVKERKNLINKIIREQDDIAITKRRFKILQTVIRHAIVAIVTITISVPIIYYAINASLEASINNYRRSQTNFQMLYKENGKISKTK